MPPTHTRKTSPTRESVWFVVVWYAGALTKTCTYFWNEGRLVTQRILLPSGFYEDDWYFYDESGSPYGFNFTNSNNESGIRYFVRNLQGDIIESGSSTSFGASHKYDAWGTITETVLGSSTNAAIFQYGYIFAYRGYQYDKETGLYYCQSRYYNSRVGRFLSADAIEIPQLTVGDLFTPNLYLYGDNNPVMKKDPKGDFPGVNLLIGGIIGAVLGAIGYVIGLVADNIFSGRSALNIKINYKDLGIAALWGAVEGIISATSISAIWGRVAAAVTSGLQAATSGGGPVDVILSAVIGAVFAGAGAGNKVLNKFNFNRASSAVKKLNSKGIKYVKSEISKALKYVLKSNDTLYTIVGKKLLKNTGRELLNTIGKEGSSSLFRTLASKVRF